MNWVNKIIAFFSPRMCRTNELAELNDIWERFNNGEDIEQELNSKDWKYHQDRVSLLRRLIKLEDNQD